ncbi:hypothetical protein JOY44_18525 [Phormidium sp. CLA17]|uniref:hypothetical protein n=1 Tax=Leptolyngbya sp. Cla-17 TaxID=2803751 RepID=UPI0014923093|nr:hypothetical protein [Leptolyngbya sp. Cla-17]MBM0743584.1 hypothetical protein [Leptolyngbya sp. Cla-17]
MEFRGPMAWEMEQPNGQPRRCLNINCAKTAFNLIAETNLRYGLKATIDWYRQNAS